MKTAIIIPTLDEGPNLRRLLPRALEMADEVWVSDGGSQDDTAQIARDLGVSVVGGSANRGAQLHRAAELADADLLVFLHADTHLPPEGLRAAVAAVERGAVGGGFLVSFDLARPALRWGARWMNLRTRWTGCPLGDQAQFVRSDVYRDIGGFRPWPILEDLDFARRLKQAGPTALIDVPVVTSARRFIERGATRTVVTNWLLWSLYFLGVPPARLARFYVKVR